MKNIFTQMIRLLDYRLFLAILIIWILTCFIPGFIPDFLRLDIVLQKSEIISIMLSIITSLFGILIAFLLLSYGLFRDKFGRIALKYLTEENNIKFLINLLLIVSIHLFFNYLYINKDFTISEIDITISYISIFLFIGSMLLLFPIAFNALISPESLDYIEKQVNALNEDIILNLGNFKEIVNSKAAHTFEENELLIVQRLGLSLIKSEDTLGFMLLMKKLNDKLIELIGESNDRNLIGNLYRQITHVWEKFVEELIKTKQPNQLNYFWVMLEAHHKHFADKKIPLLYLEEFDYFIKSFIDRLFSEKETGVLQFGVRRINNILTYHYEKSLPPQEQIGFLMEIFTDEKVEDTFEISTQWDKISTDIPYYYSIILNESINCQSESLFATTLYQIDYLIEEVIRTNMGEYQKAFILHDLFSDYYYYQLEAIRQGMFKNNYRVKFVNTRPLNDIIAADFIYKKKLLTLIGDFYIELFRINKLDFTFMYPNYLGAIGRNCANKIHLGKTYKESLNYIIRVFNFLKKEFEKSPKNNNNLYQLKSEFLSFKKFHLKNVELFSKEPKPEDQVDKDLIKNLDEIISSFQNIDKPELQLGQSIIEWD